MLALWVCSFADGVYYPDTKEIYICSTLTPERTEEVKYHEF